MSPHVLLPISQVQTGRGVRGEVQQRGTVGGKVSRFRLRTGERSGFAIWNSARSPALMGSWLLMGWDCLSSFHGAPPLKDAWLGRLLVAAAQVQVGSIAKRRRPPSKGRKVRY